MSLKKDGRNCAGIYLLKSLTLIKLPKDTILGMSKFKANADDKFGLAEIIRFVFERVENIVGKRRKCWLPAFSPFPTMFSKGFLPRAIKSLDCVVQS